MTQFQADITIESVPGDGDLPLQRFSHRAMATTFEIFAVHEEGRYAQQGAWAAFDELNRIEQELSRFIENSDISRINALPANQPLKIGLDAFECLQLATGIYYQTGGAFDVTIGSLRACWFNEDKSGCLPSQDELHRARQRTGINLVRFDEAEHTVELMSEQVQVDLGGIGKGYAVDRMAQILREYGIDTALIQGGHSSVLALEAPPGKKGWPVTLSNPQDRKETLAYIYLKDLALGGSGLQKGRHIIDPATAQPVAGPRAAWAAVSTAAVADALSTAFMVMAPGQVNQYCLSHPEVSALIVLKEPGERDHDSKIMRFGPWKDN